MYPTVLAIDPGNEESAYAIYRPDYREIVAFGKRTNAEILQFIKDANSTPNEELVIEQIASYGMAVGATVFETVFWSGRFAQAWGRDFHRIKRGEVKMHLCQSMRAKDGNIRQALIDRFGPPGTKRQPGKTYGISGDCWAALAVAVTFADTKLLPHPNSPNNEH